MAVKIAQTRKNDMTAARTMVIVNILLMSLSVVMMFFPMSLRAMASASMMLSSTDAATWAGSMPGFTLTKITEISSSWRFFPLPLAKISGKK